MDFIITFFRDILDGPVYIVVTVICSILICACIGYLAEKSQKKKKEKDQYVQIENAPVSPVPTTNVVSTTVAPTPVVSTTSAMPEVTTVPVPGGGVPPAVSQPASPGVEINMPSVQPIPTTVVPPVAPAVSSPVPGVSNTTGVNPAAPTMGMSTSVNPK